MKIHICNDNKVFPFLYVDDWYTPEEEKLIWKELDFYTNPTAMSRAENDPATGFRDPAKTIPMSKSWRLYLYNMYSGLIQGRKKGDISLPPSHILRLQPPFKKLPKELLAAIDETGPNFRLLSIINSSYTIVNYYDDNDYYESHRDHFVMSSVVWFHRKPKAYTGGDFRFTDTDITLECKHNRHVMFPSYYNHEILPIKMKDKNLEMGWGRYGIQSFHTHTYVPPEPKKKI